ncbi:MAG: NAD(P)/FAD-dependent oxidoreductase, partial [Pyrinomonadaceae bacterium]|nr:NAD(P)/FAD-dependent oxidoreductase [Pyrinomonadaceae bacterium]
MDRFATDILVIGGGPAGMSAAIAAAENGAGRVTVVDDNPYLGGQIWRAEMGRIGSPLADKIVEQVYSGEIDVLNSVNIFAQNSEKSLLGEHSNGSFEFRYNKLILATGARERFLPFEGWTLPNVFGAAGLQALVKSGMPVEDKKVIVSGTGPLLLAVAEYLKKKGARVPLILEQTSRSNLAKFGFKLLSAPGKLAEALKLMVSIKDTSYSPNSIVTSAEGRENLEAVNIRQGKKQKRIECDVLACGFHLVPNTELASLIGCKIIDSNVIVDEYQETSVKDVFCAGEPTGIGGVELSLVEGTIAGLAAVCNNARAMELFSKRKRLQGFAESINGAFSLGDELKTLPGEATFVCRCEDVTFGILKDYKSFRDAKLQTRCGMGACQGRICGPATEVL